MVPQNTNYKSLRLLANSYFGADGIKMLITKPLSLFLFLKGWAFNLGRKSIYRNLYLIPLF
jgi:hypothetical protein